MNAPTPPKNILPARDNEGYLLEPAEWSPYIAELIAKEDGIIPTPTHWQVIHFIRTYYEEHEAVPEARQVLSLLSRNLDLDRHQASEALYALFPRGYGQQACRIAGMRKPLKLMLDI